MLRILIISFFLFLSSSVVYAQSSPNDTTPCGMEKTAAGESVQSQNGDICDEDLSFQGLYLLYSDIFKDPVFRIMALFFVEESVLDNKFTEFANNQMGLSSVVYALLTSVAVLSWAFMGPLVAFKLYQYTMAVRKAGSLQFAQGKGDTVKFVSYFAFLILMSIPVGTIMMGQGVGVVLSLPSIMGGNYVFSTYMHSFRSSDAEIKMDDDILLMSSQSAASHLVEGELCQDRTRKALFSLNGGNFATFYNAEIVDVNPVDVHRVYSSCLSYTGNGKEGIVDNSLSSLSLTKSDGWRLECPQISFWSLNPGYYAKEQHGFDHLCGKIEYDLGGDMYGSLLGDQHSELNQSMDDVIEGLMASFTTEQFYNKHKQQNGPLLYATIHNESLSEEQRFATMETISKQAADAIKSSLDLNPTLSRGRTDEIQFMHLAVGASLLGGTVDSGVLRRLYESLSRSQVNTMANYYFGADPAPYKPFGIDHILEDAKEVSNLIQQYHCAMNWSKYGDTRIEITKYNSSDDIKDTFPNGMPSLECVEFLSEEKRGSTDLDRYWRYMVNDPRSNSDISAQGDGTWVKTSAFDADTQKYMSEVVAKRIYRDIRHRQLLIATYIAGVQRALADNLAKKLETSLNKRNSDYDLRSRGWAVFGGALLYLNKVQNSSAHMSNSIQEIFKVQVAGQQETYIQMDAFSPAEQDKLNARLLAAYTPLQQDAALAIGYGGMMDHPGPQGISPDDSDEISMNNFMRMMEQWTMGPFQHIKEAGGLPSDKRLTEGLKECFDEGYSHCVSGQKHPITAMMRFGDDMMNNMLNIMIVRAVVKTINRLAVGAQDGLGTIEANGSAPGGDAGEKGSSYDAHKKASKSFLGDALKKSLSFVKGAVSRLLAVLTVITIPAETILDAMMPFVVMLFVAGALFAYLIPLTAYLYGFMLLALWFLGISVIAFVWPLYALSKLTKIERDYKRGFQELYETFLGPYLRPLFYGIAAVLAFSFMYVVVFISNTVFGLVYEGLSTSSRAFSMTSFLFEIFLYAIYLATIFIMFRYALGIMKSFPDMMLSKLRLQRSNDEKFIDSLGFETYVNASIVKELANSLNSGVDKASGGSYDQWKTDKQFKDFNKMVDDAGGPEAFAQALNHIQSQGGDGRKQTSAPAWNPAATDVTTANHAAPVEQPSSARSPDPAAGGAQSPTTPPDTSGTNPWDPKS